MTHSATLQLTRERDCSDDPPLQRARRRPTANLEPHEGTRLMGTGKIFRVIPSKIFRLAHCATLLDDVAPGNGNKQVVQVPQSMALATQATNLSMMSRPAPSDGSMRNTPGSIDAGRVIELTRRQHHARRPTPQRCSLRRHRACTRGCVDDNGPSGAPHRNAATENGKGPVFE